jgi:hypothetical protein
MVEARRPRTLRPWNRSCNREIGQGALVSVPRCRVTRTGRGGDANASPVGVPDLNRLAAPGGR